MKQKHTRGRIITSYREVHGLTKEELGQKFGQKGDGSLAKFESGERPLSDELALEVMDKLGLPRWEQLLGPDQLTLWKKISARVEGGGGR